MSLTHEPMDIRDPEIIILRNYRDSMPYQWAREALQNSLEAGASRIEFGIEWQAIRFSGVYRRTIIDDGCGLSAEEMPMFLNTYGASGKPIGGEHQNFGVGFKSSVLPWNKEGVVVISLKNGEQNVMWLQQHPKTKQFGALRMKDDDGRYDSVIPPDELRVPGYAIDWSQILPQWVHEAGHGTAIVLLGNNRNEDTFRGNPERGESPTGLVKYLNTRYFDLSHVNVAAALIEHENRTRWPKSYDDAALWRNRAVSGALNIIRKDRAESALQAEGALEFSSRDITPCTIRWYLRSGTPKHSGWDPTSGFVAQYYRNELFLAMGSAYNRMRSFGVVGRVAKNLFIIIEPREHDPDNPKAVGVYPNGVRTELLLGGLRAGSLPPMDDWADFFRANMPQPIRDAIAASRDPEEQPDDDDLKRFKEVWGDRWRSLKYRIQVDGSARTDGNSSESDVPRRKRKVRPVGPDPRDHHTGSSTENIAGSDGNDDDGCLPAEKRSGAYGLPECQFGPKEDFEADWVLASYTPATSGCPNGLVMINKDHPVLIDHVAEAASQYPEHEEETVRSFVMQAYRKIAISHVAHVEQFRNYPGLGKKFVNESLRNDEAMTMALLGLVSAEAMFGPSLGAKLGRKMPRQRELVKA